MGILEGLIKPIFKTKMMFALFGKAEQIIYHYNGPVYNIYAYDKEKATEIVRDVHIPETTPQENQISVEAEESENDK